MSEREYADHPRATIETPFGPIEIISTGDRLYLYTTGDELLCVNRVKMRVNLNLRRYGSAVDFVLDQGVDGDGPERNALYAACDRDSEDVSRAARKKLLETLPKVVNEWLKQGQDDFLLRGQQAAVNNKALELEATIDEVAKQLAKLRQEWGKLLELEKTL